VKEQKRQKSSELFKFYFLWYKVTTQDWISCGRYWKTGNATVSFCNNQRKYRIRFFLLFPPQSVPN